MISFLRKVFDLMTGKKENQKLTEKKEMLKEEPTVIVESATKVWSEEELLKAIDTLPKVEPPVKDAPYQGEQMVKVSSPRLWSTFKYLSSMGTDENGYDTLFFVIPTFMDNRDGHKSVSYLYFPLNGGYNDIDERKVNVP
jgi:hypothetical protein